MTTAYAVGQLLAFVVLGFLQQRTARKVDSAVAPAAKAAENAETAAQELQPINGRRQAEIIQDLVRGQAAIARQLHEHEANHHRRPDRRRQPPQRRS